MPRRFGTLMTFILDAIDLDIPLIPLEDPFHFANRKRQNNLERKRYLETLWHMQRRGYLRFVKKNNEKFIKLTEKGQLEKLFQKADVKITPTWDGKWRVVIFDIPEGSHLARDRFRWLLKRNSFFKLQASVFVSPHSLNRQALDFLEQSGLKQFIRILKVEEMDNDRDLRKRFGLQNPRPRIKKTGQKS